MNFDTTAYNFMNRHQATENPKPQKKTKKRIICLVDVYDWAFFNIASRIKKQLTQYEIDILTEHDFITKNNEDSMKAYHIYIFFIPGEPFIYPEYINKIRNAGLHHFGQKSKIYFCQYDNFSWRFETQGDTGRKQRFLKNMKAAMNECDGYFWGSPKIRDNIYDTFDNLKLNASCMDGVDSTMFKFKEYNKDILTRKKLRIGWIGNSDPWNSGIQKGFKEIKQYIQDLSGQFEFYPLDRQVKQIPHNEVPNYIYSIDIIVCFSTCEGTPNQILESSSCGRCWVSTDVGIVNSVYNTIEDNPTGIIIKKNERCFKEALMQLYNNRELIVEYGKNGRKAIEVKWDWKFRTEGFERMFKIGVKPV